ncbi:hypothetical protein R70006_06179 [Paraburkholderia domus]|uniref:hypothetical protein n=1 Tax=Paraburkholderia domus TaxID=2793075 RepID=UPI0019143951|nr:hypothetical protein [Paraburkholderia domus]MBK5052813.1 hypothetical protein [Burkholderia sp. R-70006]CAE6820598.1 hypothetical protein R70006_06179 [Paraburkholderia domus]
MHVNWIDVAGLLVIVWLAVRHLETLGRAKKLEAEVRRLEVQCNTNEMNIKKLYHFRDVEVYEANGALSDVDRREFENELAAEIERLADRNKFLTSH